MNDQNTPYGVNEMQAAPAGTTAAGQKPRWFKRTWVVAIGAVILGIAIGSADGGDDVSASAESAATASDLAGAEEKLADAEVALAATKAELTDIAGDVPEREAAVAEAESDLADRGKAVSKAEAAVAKREKAVGVVEKEISANTVPGEGVFEVGVDIKAGTYKTAGTANCYYAVNADANGNNIKSNNFTDGPATVVVGSGEFFESRGCAEWVLQR